MRNWTFRLSACIAIALAGLMAAGCAKLHGGKSVAAHRAAQRADLLPQLRLSPKSLGRTLAEQKVLTIKSPTGKMENIDAVLEVDAQSLRLAFLQMGRVIARIIWDGTDLQATHARGWPKALSQERILSDLQMALWPLPEVRAGLPPSWSIDQIGSTRRLREHDEYRVVFTTHEHGRMDIVYIQSGWSLAIRSHATRGEPRGTQ